MDLRLQGKTAFISGSTAGIGWGIANALLAEEVQVILNGRSQDSIDTAIARLRDHHPEGRVTGVVADFGDADSVQRLIASLPSVDLLINNVGTYTSQALEDSSDEDWLWQFEVNVMSGVRLSRSVLPQLLSRGWGRIIFVSSECAGLVPSDLIAYSTTKAAMLALSRGLAQLTTGTGVTVNAVLPGSTMTEGAEQFMSDLAHRQGVSVESATAQFFSDVRTSSLLQRFASVEEIASAITYLCSPLAAATNGAAIRLEGGSMGGIL
ncbi:MAG: SDR family NAD(P)-dependent oxidoreductase [Bacteroidota bacterium]